MTSERYQRVCDIYQAVCERSGHDREEALLLLCEGDAEMLAEVRSLLSYHEEVADGLGPAIADIRERLLGGGAAAAIIEESAADIPSQIGNYRILRRIGEGGMGIVYEAEQDHPQRKVAIKLIRHGFGADQLVRRFRHEAEMLGRLQHPGIAHVYEAGIHVTPMGAKIPFLAMELIHGAPLTEYVRQKKLETRERLALFARVCDAVEHAHQNGVIHRDLKPGNILIVEGNRSNESTRSAETTFHTRRHGFEDTTAQPKILDFGIARATDGDVRMATLQTSPGQLLGTVPYMSPEQAGGDSSALDTRSDVYSLGVILYELLVGRLPYELHNRSIVDAVRVIQEMEPTRIGAIDRACRGDIETLLAKALEKEKDRRYGSAAELAADIRRYLADLPLIARPASSMYQLRKFARRNRILVGSALVCVFLLIVGFIGTTTGLVSARRANEKLEKAIVDAETQRDLARQSESRATTELARSRQVVGFLRWMLRTANPGIAKGRDVTLMRELLDNSVKRLEAGGLRDQPAVEAEMRAIISETFSGLGDNSEAIRVIEPAIALARAAPQGQDADFQRVRILYAAALSLWGRNAEARDEFEHCVQAIRSGLVKEDEDAAVLYSSYADVASALGDGEKSLELNRMALENRRRFKGENHGDVTASMGNIAGSLQALKRYDEAYSILKDVLARYQSANPPKLLHLTIVETQMASLLLEMGRANEAEKCIRVAMETGPKVLQPEHHQMGETTRTLGLILRAQGRHEQARESFARATEIFSKAFSATHFSTASARLDLGIELGSLGRFAEAERELLAARQVLHGEGNHNRSLSAECSAALANLYETWDRAEPGKGYDSQAAEWRKEINVWRTTTQTVTKQP